jgi:hypothetical protein
MKKKINPFEIFGLTPKIVKELDEDVLYKLIKTIYRVLQLAYHPDKGGDPEKALELNLAFESLNFEKNPELFRELKKKYIQRLSRKTMQTKLEELRTQYRRLSFYHELLKEKFWQYLENGYEILEKKFKTGKVLKLNLFDIISHINFSDLRRVKKQMLFKEIILKEEELYKKKAYEEMYHKVKKYRFLGSIKREYIEPWTLVERDLREGGFVLKNFMKKEIFIKECLIYLQPELKKNSYVFFFYPEEYHKVYLEGILISVEEVEEKEIGLVLERTEVKKWVNQAPRNENKSKFLQKE